jgi:4-hydroxybenzoate polyprenyltransferase
MIKFSHSIFALPFALAATWLAARQTPLSGRGWVLIVLCMVAARTAAMGFNRIADRRIDALNPRTAIRELPSGQISLAAAVAFTGGAAALFVALAFALRPICGWLSPVALVVIGGYSYGKRFTALVHLWLGVALGLAPIAATLAVSGTVTPVAVLIAGAVATWVAGFDILYSLQDEDFDRAKGLHSIPARLGRTGALWVSGGLHLVTVGLLAALGPVAGLGWAYAGGWAAITGVLAWEHHLVRPGDISRIDKAFFDLNGYVSVLFLLGVVLG